MPTITDILSELRVRRDACQLELLWLEEAIVSLEKLVVIRQSGRGQSSGMRVSDGWQRIAVALKTYRAGMSAPNGTAGPRLGIAVHPSAHRTTFRQALYRALASHRKPMAVRDLEVALRSNGYASTSSDLNKTIRRFVYTDGRIRKVGPGRFKLRGKVA